MCVADDVVKGTNADGRITNAGKLSGIKTASVGAGPAQTFLVEFAVENIPPLLRSSDGSAD